MTMSRRPFYSGETIDLVVPTVEHVHNSSWADWFNDQLTTRFTAHGLMPNTLSGQTEFLESLEKGQRFALLITPSGNAAPIGVVSLSSIDYRAGRCALAIIMDLKTEESHSPFAALEASAIVTSHAFDKLGLRRVDAGQVYPALDRWSRLLQLLGYRAEGFRRDAFKRGQEVADELMLACRYETYEALKRKRGGHLWSSVGQISAELTDLPKQSFAQFLDYAIRQAEEEFFHVDEEPT
jgi:RimJ/RimL family protein N-acetyltransferase